MPKQKINQLMTELNEHFGSEQASPQQQQLMKEVADHIHAAGETLPDETPLRTLELLLESVEEEHPKTSKVIKELISTIKSLGV